MKHPRDKSLTYPYLYHELPDPKQMMENLFNEYIEGKFDINKKIGFMYRTYDHFETDSISSHFTEEIRSKCHQGKYNNFIETWATINPDKLREFKTTDSMRLFLMKNGAKECNIFSPALALHLYLDYIPKKPIKILDPSAGWGDRMIAAIAAGDLVSLYHGFDPNPALAPAYNKIIETLDESKKCSYQTIPFEDAQIRKGFYDLAMTSPPYWELEIYSEHEDQSTSRYKTYEQWIENFYTPYLNNMKYGVRSGGVIIVYVSNYTSRGVKYELEELTVSILNKSGAKLRLKGGLKTTEKGFIRPFYVFDIA